MNEGTTLVNICGFIFIVFVFGMYIGIKIDTDFQNEKYYHSRILFNAIQSRLGEHRECLKIVSDVYMENIDRGVK